MALRRLVCAMALAWVSVAGAQEVHLKIVGLNDLHGNLQSPGVFRAAPDSPEVPVGGAEVLAGYVERLTSENPHHIVVSAGDLTGGSPLISTLFHHEDTIEVANRLGLELNGVGNHEFDQGTAELMRLQHGGCSTKDANTCKGAVTGTPVPFEGAKFQYLAANVFDAKSGRTIFPGYAIKRYGGVKVAFIGLTLKDTPTIVVSSQVAGLRFAEEAETVNGIVRRLRRQGIESFVVLIHQGGYQTTPPDTKTVDINGCAGGLEGYPIRDIVGKLDDAVDLVLSAHTHAAYVCRLPNSAGRTIPVTSASAFGRVVTDIDVTLSRKTRDVTAVTARNVLVDRTDASVVPDAAIKKIVDGYATLAAPITNRVVGSVKATLLKSKSDNEESAVGDVIADAQLEATRAQGAQVAFMNAGGIRADVPFSPGLPGVPDGMVTYGELFAVHPFGNWLVTMTLTGEQIRILLEEQYKGCALGGPAGAQGPTSNRSLNPSAGFSYAYRKDGPACGKVVPGSIRIGGAALDPAAKYRVTVNSLLADGGAEMYVLKQGTDRAIGTTDLEALMAYFASHPDVAPPTGSRIQEAP